MVATMRPSGDQAAPRIMLVWPSRVKRSRPLVASQILAVSSQLVVSRLSPFGLKLMLDTHFECPGIMARSALLFTSHILTRPSLLPAAIVRPSRLHAIHVTPLGRPSRLTYS